MATIKDIAQLAGVSHGTVSNVLNGRGNVSMQKILQVEKAAHQLGYSMDERARWLRSPATTPSASFFPIFKTIALQRCILPFPPTCSRPATIPSSI